MSEYYNITPWRNHKEWNEVYEKIYSPTSTDVNKIEALNLLQVWKARCPFLPSGIESTLTLLEVHIQDLKQESEGNISEQVLRLAYSAALIRFVNHMLDTETIKGSSLYQAAKNSGIPDWIIDLRHDAAHSNYLPSIELLREAAQFGLDWLQTKYWNEYKEHSRDYISGQKEFHTNDENRIAAVINFCTSISICAHSKCKYKKLGQIPDIDMRESIANDARDLFGHSIDLSNLNTVLINSLICVMNAQSQKLLKAKDKASLVNKNLLNEDSVFLSLDLLNYMGKSDFYNNSKLNKHYLRCFEVLLTFLHTNDLILDVILELIKMTQISNQGNDKNLLVALWISEILKALKRSKDFIDRMNKVNFNRKRTKTRKDLKLLYQHWFPNDKAYGLLLDLYKPVPKELTNIDYIQPIISSYNSYLTYFVQDLLNLLHPHLPAMVSEKICQLAKLISSPGKISTTISKIYTIEDLKLVQDEIHISTEQNECDSECMETFERLENKEINFEKNKDQLTNDIWRLASEYDWSNCPIGQMPLRQVCDPMEI